MVIELFLRNNATIKVQSNYVTLENFAEDLMAIGNGSAIKGTHMNKYGDFIDFYSGGFIRYTDIVAFNEVAEKAF